MNLLETDFVKTLKKEKTDSVSIYCPGYPELDFLKKYQDLYNIEIGPTNLTLIEKNYEIIKKMGFDAISLWDFRRRKGGYQISKQVRVDGWGRLYKNDWYLWDGVFKDEKTIENWEHLQLPSKENLRLLEKFLPKLKNKLNLVLSLPGLFEKTWQSMGFIYFSKCLKKNNLSVIQKVVDFFSDYLERLILTLENVGADLFLVADDCGYKNNEFIPKAMWKKLFSENYHNIVNSIHDHNKLVILHSDGYVSNLIDIFIEIGFDAIQSLEPSAGVDIISLFEEYNNRICFIGNLDISFLAYGTPIQIKNYVIKLISKAEETNTPLIISPTQQIDAIVKPENLRIMIETAKNYNLLKNNF
ncbi:MAG: uroporphyrinogen decarboxylase family protein [Promethearchaeota archaeon]